MAAGARTSPRVNEARDDGRRPGASARDRLEAMGALISLAADLLAGFPLGEAIEPSPTFRP